jgi:hypothetical protein
MPVPVLLPAIALGTTSTAQRAEDFGTRPAASGPVGIEMTTSDYDTQVADLSARDFKEAFAPNVKLRMFVFPAFAANHAVGFQESNTVYTYSVSRARTVPVSLNRRSRMEAPERRLAEECRKLPLAMRGPDQLRYDLPHNTGHGTPSAPTWPKRAQWFRRRRSYRRYAASGPALHATAWSSEPG